MTISTTAAPASVVDGTLRNLTRRGGVTSSEVVAPLGRREGLGGVDFGLGSLLGVAGTGSTTAV
ncbi:MAG TPA: hypothetical protein VFB50_01935, partial [Chloroflexota bacterium]|nr:hypothetical protein [Chloroflexota bacterium]